ncbi:MAG TPA: hypothetical protein VK324_00480, partial [Tepidisphaeraceae bacterium]|nr:hypothetical protein [Tepidisphaeraceae bacterium]
AVAGEPPPLTDPVLPKGVLLDELGQSALRDWPGKSRTPAEVTARLNQQLAAARQQAWPKGFSRWGGWSGAKLTDATGFFAAHHDGDRWWLVDPDGHPFFSAGMDCTAPDPHAVYAGLDAALAWLPPADGEFAEAHTGRSAFNYLVASLIRAFGPADWKRHWRTITIAQLKKFGINTVGNWSDWEAASAAKFPYVRPLHYAGELAPNVFRDFPDVFHPDFPDDAADYASQLARTRDDPAMVGYFLMNEPTWGFARQSPAAGMLYTTDGGHAREALAAFVRDRHNTDAALAAAWGMAGVALADLAAGRWTRHLTAAAERDLDAFSTVMTARFFDTLSAACRAVDPNHLNLGARYYTVPPDWALAGMTSFDVFSINCYRERVPAKDLEHIGQLTGRPTLVGEWHFGALDVGLPASGIGHVPTQTDRGRAYRVYLEHAAALPWCVGVHHFTLYDESALGRFDGENYNVGFLDTCNRPYDPLCDAARRSHERMYGVAAGEQPPVDDAPQYLPKLFC